MIRLRSRCFLVLAVLLLPYMTLPSARAEEAVQLTLKDAIRMAIERNLDVKAELYNPAISEADIRKNKGIYDPLLTFSADYTNAATQPASIYQSLKDIYRQKIFTADAGIAQLIPIGGTVGLSFNNLWNRTNTASSSMLGEYWQSELALSYSQPLLKNFGKDATELGIAVAVNNKTAAVDQFAGRVMDVVTKVRTAYFTLYSLKENLEAKKTALALARKILEDTKGRVRAGVLPAMEILNAEFGVAAREKELIDAEKSLNDQQDVVRLLLQVAGGREINPIDPPEHQIYEVEEEKAIRRALVDRPDLKAQRVAVDTLDLQSRVAHNRILPDLTFNASAALAGLGREYGRGLDVLGTGDYPVWGVGLQFVYPIGNRGARNEYIKSRLKSDQARVQLRNLEDSIRNEVRAAIRGIRANFQQLDVARRGLAYAEERLRAYIKKNEVGLATTKDVFDVQNDLVTAKVNQIQAQAEYTLAISQLWKVTGELLEREGIVLSGKEADALYDSSSH